MPIVIAFLFLLQNRRVSFVISRCLLGRTSRNKNLFDFDFFTVINSFPYYSVIKIETNFSGKFTVFEIRRRHIFVKIINFWWIKRRSFMRLVDVTRRFSSDFDFTDHWGKRIYSCNYGSSQEMILLALHASQCPFQRTSFYRVLKRLGPFKYNVH